ncbi:MAG: hypothetical protein Ct9H300mP6_17060 [Gammaproteobacteria bacterium]|nr:MAG: hypothetical protein Ct9H300mP6_17060 [Gammaproteobacteria bacterium]
MKIKRTEKRPILENLDRPITERNPLTQTKDLFDNKEKEVADSNDALDILDVPNFFKRQDA